MDPEKLWPALDPREAYSSEKTVRRQNAREDDLSGRAIPRWEREDC
jgi:hypothetical protein